MNALVGKLSSGQPLKFSHYGDSIHTAEGDAPGFAMWAFTHIGMNEQKSGNRKHRRSRPPGSHDKPA